MLFTLNILFLMMISNNFYYLINQVKICPNVDVESKFRGFIQWCDLTGTHIPICTHTCELCIAPRAAGRRHGRYKWAGQPVVPSGHKEETHSPAAALRVWERHERKSWRMRDRGERRWWPKVGGRGPDGSNIGISEGLAEEEMERLEVEEALSRWTTYTLPTGLH